jgi:Uma2 family endonuclease
MTSLGKGGPMTVATDRRMTLQEFLTYDDGTNTRYELADGVLVEMSLGTVKHGRAVQPHFKALNRLRSRALK